MESNVLAGNERMIDVERVIEQKNARLAKLIPSFVIRYLKRIIHQDEVNAFLTAYKSKHGLEFVDAAIKVFDPIIIIEGLHNVADNKRIVIASNHPLGGLDGIVLIFYLTSKICDRFLFQLINMVVIRKMFVS